MIIITWNLYKILYTKTQTYHSFCHKRNSQVPPSTIITFKIHTQNLHSQQVSFLDSSQATYYMHSCTKQAPDTWNPRAYYEPICHSTFDDEEKNESCHELQPCHDHSLQCKTRLKLYQHLKLTVSFHLASCDTLPPNEPCLPRQPFQKHTSLHHNEYYRMFWNNNLHEIIHVNDHPSPQNYT